MKRMLTLVLILGGLLVPGQAFSQKVLVECEWYYDFEDLGGVLLRRIPCVSASNDSTVDGYDIVGEWTRLWVTFPAGGSYDISLRAAGQPTMENEIHLTLLTDSGPARNQTSEFFTLGYGLG